MDLCDRIKELRLEKSLTLEGVAKIAGVSASTIMRYENGDIKNLRRDKIKKLADALGTTPAYLMGWEIPAYDGPTSSAAEDFKDIIENTQTDDKELLSHYNRLNQTGQNEAVKRVEELTHIKKYTEEESTPLHLLPNAAHENENATEEDKAHDEQFWDDFED